MLSCILGIIFYILYILIMLNIYFFKHLWYYLSYYFEFLWYNLSYYIKYSIYYLWYNLKPYNIFYNIIKYIDLIIIPLSISFFIILFITILLFIFLLIILLFSTGDANSYMMTPDNIDRMSNIGSKVHDLIYAASNDVSGAASNANDVSSSNANDVSGTACNTIPNPHGFNEANFPDNWKRERAFKIVEKLESTNQDFILVSKNLPIDDTEREFVKNLLLNDYPEDLQTRIITDGYHKGTETVVHKNVSNKPEIIASNSIRFNDKTITRLVESINKNYPPKK